MGNIFTEAVNNMSYSTAISGVGSLFSGFSQYNQSKEQASDYEEQGVLVLQQSLRDASIIREEGIKFAAKQSLQYIGSGVELVGSALITMEQTRMYANTEANAVEKQGRARRDYAFKQAKRVRNEGRAELIGSIIKTGAMFLTAGV